MLGVALLKIPVSDLPRALAFYEDALGLAATAVVEAYGWARLDGASVGLVLYVPGRGGGDGTPGGEAGFHLSSADLDALLERARRHDPQAAIAVNDDGSRSLDVRDPDGTLVRVMERR